MKAVIPAAGEGSRMGPVTDVVPKEILPVGGKPAIHHVVDEAIRAGITEFVVVIAPGKAQLVEYLGGDDRFPNRVEIHFTVQSQADGLGDAVLQARPLIEPDETFALLYPDNIVLHDASAIGDLVDLHEQLDAPVSHVIKVPVEEIKDYSAIQATETESGLHRIHDMVEKPRPGEAPSNLAPIGRHVLPSGIFAYLDKTEPGHNGEIQLTDAMARRAREKAHFAKELEGERLDVGNHPGFVEANLVMGLRNEIVSADRIHASRDLRQPENEEEA